MRRAVGIAALLLGCAGVATPAAAAPNPLVRFDGVNLHRLADISLQ
jgi:hypothetical protein